MRRTSGTFRDGAACFHAFFEDDDVETPDVTIPDALIMAYADGELQGSLAARIRDAIDTDEETRRKYEIYDGSRRLLASVFDGVLSEPVPDRLKEAIATPCVQNTQTRAVTSAPAARTPGSARPPHPPARAATSDRNRE